MSLQFTKEAVTLQPRTHGLLSSTLAAPRPEPVVQQTSSSSVFSAGAGIGRPVRASDPTDNALSVKNVVDAILRTARSDPALAALQLHGDPAQFTLLVAEDDGQVDHDFPEIDGSVPITTVGIDKFVLCRSDSESPVLRVVIPSSSVALRACEMPAANGGSRPTTPVGGREAGMVTEQPLLTVTCYPVGGAGTRSFTVTIPS